MYGLRKECDSGETNIIRRCTGRREEGSEIAAFRSLDRTLHSNTTQRNASTQHCPRSSRAFRTGTFPKLGATLVRFSFTAMALALAACATARTPPSSPMTEVPRVVAYLASWG